MSLQLQLPQAERKLSNCIRLLYKTKTTRDLRNTEKSLDEALVILEEQKAAARQEHTNLENEIAYRETDDYVKDQAKEIFGLRDPEDTIFIPGSDEAADEKK